MIEPSDCFKACADETRLRLLMLLREGDFCVCELVSLTELPQPKISKHLRRLRELDLVKTKRDDNFVRYSLREHEVLRQTLEIVRKNLDAYETLRKDHERITDRAILRERYHSLRL